MSALLPAIIGHRGAAADAPENTLASFREAARQGARMVVFDG
jgi:glycerophosphoryl diester phosphodiesterase